MSESPRLDMDDAIDRVAARLVAVTDDSRLLQRVMTRLPERAAPPWFAAMPVQLAAGGALVLIAFLYARPWRESAPSALPRITAIVPLEVPDPGSRIPVEPIDSRLPSPDSRLPGDAVDRPDHERSLPPVAPLESLAVASIDAPAIEADALDPLAPLVLTELPLASDASSPHQR